MPGGLREFLAGAQVSLPVSRLAQYKTTLQMVMLGFLLFGSAGPMFGPFSTTDIGVAGLWIAAMLTLVTGYDYLQAGLRHVDEMDNQARLDRATPESSKPAVDTKENKSAA